MELHAKQTAAFNPSRECGPVFTFRSGAFDYGRPVAVSEVHEGTGRDVLKEASSVANPQLIPADMRDLDAIRKTLTLSAKPSSLLLAVGPVQS